MTDIFSAKEPIDTPLFLQRLAGVMPLFFFSPLLLLTVLAIYARQKRPTWYGITKPLPLVWILVWSAFWLFFSGTPASLSKELIFIGLVLGLGGDVFLLKKEYFLAGYLCFLGGHAAYIAGFFLQSPFVLSWQMLVPVLALALSYALFVSSVTPHKSKIPLILAYALVIALMLLGALNVLAAANFVGSTSRLLFLGALFFCVSDGLWSYHNFVRPLPWPGIWILSTYYAGQSLIAFGSFF